MKVLTKFLAVMLAFGFLCCGPKSDQTTEERSDQIDEQLEEMDQPEEVEPQEELQDQSEEVEDTNTEANMFDPGERPADSIKTYTLKWMDIWRDEYGPMYGFEDRNKKKITFYHIDIDDFSELDNPYFEHIESDQSIMGLYVLKDGIKDQWFNVRVEKYLFQLDGADGESWNDVITKIESVN